jgi:HEAT repeat protein
LVDAVAAIGSDAREAAPELIGLLASEPAYDVQTQRSLARGVCEALVAIGSGTDDIVPTLVASLQNPKTKIRGIAARSLEFIADENLLEADWEVVALALAKALEDVGVVQENVPDYVISDDKSSIGKALTRLGSPARVAVPTLVKLLKAPDSGTRLGAAKALAGLVTPRHTEALPSLVDSLLDSTMRQHHAFRPSAIRAIFIIDGGADRAESACLKQLASPNAKARLRAIDAMSEIAKRTSVTRQSELKSLANRWLPALIVALDDDDIDVVRGAARTLGHLGQHAKPAIPALKERLIGWRLAKDYRQALEKIDPQGSVNPGK